MLHVLIVEDEKPISNLIRMSLTKEGFHCTCAYDGGEAADLLEKIVKPFDTIELLARIDVVMRRYQKCDMVIEVGGVRIDTASMRVWREDEEISLTKTEYDLLLLFARNPRRAMYRETIYERVWGEEYPFGSKAVDLHVQRLRKKVGWESTLQAVNKVGYRLEV